MGYVISLVDAEFFIEARDKPYALADIPGPTDDEGNVRPWMYNVNPNSWNYLTDAMEDWRHPIELDSDGNVVDIDFTGEKIGDEKEMFESIAEYVEDESFIEYVGEDGRRFMYVFYGDSVEEVTHKEIVLDETFDLVSEALGLLEGAGECQHTGNMELTPEDYDQIVDLLTKAG